MINQSTNNNKNHVNQLKFLDSVLFIISDESYNEFLGT